MKKKLINLLLIALVILACSNERKNGNTLIAKKNHVPNKAIVPQTKPIVNVYIENSGSMDGYVRGVTEFEQAVYSYLSDIKISNFSNTLNLFYINSKIIPQGSDISDFIERLEPSTFKIKGGNRGTSDIANVLDSIFSDTQKNEMAILVTDGIFSPGKGKDADQYLVNQQIGIKSSMAEYLKKYPNAAIIVYQLSSNFDGDYYNKEDKITKINSQRPYYIWVIGQANQLDELRNKVPDNKFKGGGVKNVFSILGGNKKVVYAVKMGSGTFDLDKKDPKTTIKNLEKNSKGNQNQVTFSVNVNLSGMLINDNYLKEKTNYEVSQKDYKLTVTRAASNKFGYTHTLNLSSDKVHKGQVNIKLKNQLPGWVNNVNDDDGSLPLANKTYGIKYQIQGIYEAFTFDDDYYTEIKININ